MYDTIYEYIYVQHNYIITVHLVAILQQEPKSELLRNFRGSAYRLTQAVCSTLEMRKRNSRVACTHHVPKEPERVSLSFASSRNELSACIILWMLKIKSLPASPKQHNVLLLSAWFLLAVLWARRGYLLSCNRHFPWSQWRLHDSVMQNRLNLSYVSHL